MDAGYTYYVNPSTSTGTGVGYMFSADRPATPDSLASNIISDQTINFVAVPVGGLRISGKIYNGGSLLPGAEVTLVIDNVAQAPVISSDGTYEFNGLLAHSKYEVKVHKEGLAFIPKGTTDDGYRLFADMIVSQVQDFASNTPMAVLSGRIYKAPSTGIANVPVTITSASFNTNAVTDDNGDYSAQVAVNSVYTITPIDNPDQGYHYQNSDNSAQNYRTTTSLTGNLSGQNFIAVVNTYTITGTIFVPSNVLAGSIKVRLYDTTGSNGVIPVISTEVGVNGNFVYAFSNVPGLRNYLIVPELANYAFSPNNRTLVNLLGHKSGQDFTATNSLGPKLVYPANNAQAIELQPNFMWEAPKTGSAPTGYKIQVSTSADFSNAKEYSANVLNYNGFVLLESNTYFWRVQSQSASGNNWSEVWTFNTQLSAPELLTPAKNSTSSVTPTFTWKVVQGAGKYDIEIRKQSVGLTGTPTNPDLESTTLSLTIASALENNTVYIWRARAKNSSGTSKSAWSETWSFTTDASKPSLISPAYASIGQPTNLTFKWAAVPGAQTYTLEYTQNPNFASAVTVIDVDGTSQAVSGLVMNATYFWRVKVKAPVPSSYSEVWYFNVGGSFAWSPSSLSFGNILVGKSSASKVKIFNNGIIPISVSNAEVSDEINYNTPSSGTKLDIAAGETKEIIVNFTPRSIGSHPASLLIYHNVASQPLNPIVVPLSGTGASTFATLNLPSVIDFGTVVYNSGSRDTSITLLKTVRI